MRDTLVKLYREHRVPLYRCAWSVLRDNARAEDAVHDAFCKMLKMKQDPVDPLRYAMRAVRNAALDIAARRHPGPATAAEPAGHAHGPGEQAVEAEKHHAVRDALMSLRAEHREVVELHLWSGLTFEQIAEVLARPIGTVTSWYRRGLDALKQQMEDDHA